MQLTPQYFKWSRDSFSTYISFDVFLRRLGFRKAGNFLASNFVTSRVRRGLFTSQSCA